MTGWATNNLSDSNPTPPPYCILSAQNPTNIKIPDPSALPQATRLIRKMAQKPASSVPFCSKSERTAKTTEPAPS